MAEPQAATAPSLNVQGVQAAQGGQIDRAITLFRQAIETDPAFDDARHNLMGASAARAQALVRGGQLEAATQSFLGQVDAFGDERQTRRNAAQFLAGLSHAWREKNNAGMYLTLARKAVQLAPDYPGPRTHLEGALLVTGQPAELEDYTAAVTREELGRHVFIAPFPKSGSSFLKNLLCKMTGYPETFHTFAFFQNEQELYLPYLEDTARKNTVTQQHVRPTVANVHLFQGFCIRPIILVRNIYDVLLSWKEFLEGGAHINTFFPDFATLPQETQFDLVIADRLTWYLSFYAGWQQVQGLETIWLTYEDLIADTPAELMSISDFYGLGRTEPEIDSVIEAVSGKKASNRFNKGVAGRGAEAFNDAQKERIQAATAFFPGVDFSMIGL